MQLRRKAEIGSTSAHQPQVDSESQRTGGSEIESWLDNIYVPGTRSRVIFWFLKIYVSSVSIHYYKAPSRSVREILVTGIHNNGPRISTELKDMTLTQSNHRYGRQVAGPECLRFESESDESSFCWLRDSGGLDEFGGSDEAERMKKKAMNRVTG
ncbi:hypothetical protein EX30DRAFT_351029 [Ascodesmis nigricans]|uniref:Uncharacterized protein n=1 Tax=Ascodesmis nigricans TaxID=341454 RepID=A0A4V3SI28_9PEZI|nr:hypothetical protein EX30DRAFT_351029 [Ascodesmis nigricans]